MKKDSVMVLIIAVLLVVIGFLLFSKNKKEAPVALNEEPVFVQNVTSKDIMIEKEDELVSIKAKYPDISGLQNKKANDSINAFLKKEIEQIINDFRGNASPVDQDSVSEKNQMQISFKVLPVYMNYLSLTFEVWEYYWGAAHGNPYTMAYVFDTETGKRLFLRDFFKEDSEYLSIISEKVRAILPEVLGDWYDPDWVKIGTEPQEEIFQTFYLSQGGFVFVFDPYLIAPYAAGRHEVEILRSELQGYLK